MTISPDNKLTIAKSHFTVSLWSKGVPNISHIKVYQYIFLLSFDSVIQTNANENGRLCHSDDCKE